MAKEPCIINSPWIDRTRMNKLNGEGTCFYKKAINMKDIGIMIKI